jgi:pimeloyl-ACP methyl ester carboxylesterase
MSIAGTLCLVVVLAVLGLAAFLYWYLTRQGKYFDSNGVQIHYHEAGAGAPVILVHGFAVTAVLNWMVPRIYQRLAKHHRVIALDTRGHGRSGKPHDPAQYGVEMAEDVVRLMDHLGIAKAHVVGYSLGGFIVLKLAVTHPERLLSAVPCGAGWTSKPETELGFIGELAEDLDAGRGVLRLLERLRPAGQPVHPWQERLVDWLMRVTNDPRALAALMHGMPGLLIPEADLRNNVTRCLAVIGERDPLKAFADRLVPTMANLEYYVTPRGDHMTTPFFAETKRRIETFLDRSPA